MDRHRSAGARRLYHHHVNGGTLTDDDVSLLVQYIEELEEELQESNDELGEFESGAMNGESCESVWHRLAEKESKK